MPMNTETEYPNFPFWKTLWGYFQPWRWHLLGAILLNLIVGVAITIETAIPIEEKVSQEFSEKAEQLGRRAFSLSMTNSIESIKVEGLSYVFYAILAYMGSLLYLKSRLSIGELLGFLSAFTLLRGPLANIFQASVLQGAAHAGLNRIESVFQEQSTTPDPPAAARPVLPAQPIVTFEDVSFAYEDRPTLSHVSFTIP